MYLTNVLKRITILVVFLSLACCKILESQSGTRPSLGFEDIKTYKLGGCMDYYGIPGCSWAVIRSGKIDTMGTEGVIFSGSKQRIKINHHFQIGSMGKSYTSLIAARCVEKGLINWNSRLFDILPEWKKQARIDYHSITLKELLSHQTRLQPLNYHKTHVDKKTGSLVYENMPNFYGSDYERRQQFCRYALTLSPVNKTGMNYTNSGYCIAGAMLEKVTGKTWEALALELADSLGIKIGFERPNRTDSLQPWGHLRHSRRSLEAISPTEVKIYNDPISSPAGNIHINISDFSVYVIQFMNGLKGIDGAVSSKTIRYMLGEVDGYSMGWYNDRKDEQIYYHYGSEGTFYTHMMIFADLDAAIIIFTNSPNDKNTVHFLNDARNYLKGKFIYESF